MTLLWFVVGRLAGAVVTLLIASAAVFGALYLAPGDVVTTLLGGSTASPEAIETVRDQYHLNDPIFVQYWDWLVRLLHGDLGQSAIFHDSVASLLAPRFVNTMLLVTYATFIVTVFGVGLGILAGLYPKRVGKAISAVTSVLVAVPSFVAAVLLVALFSVNLGWFPVLGAGSGFVGHVSHLTLPAIALALASTAYVANVTTSEVRNEARRDHVVTARARGVPRWTIVRRHVVRNSMIPVTTAVGIVAASLIAGGAIIEVAFGINGIGAYLVEAVQQRDVVVVQAIALILVAAFVVISLLVDIAYVLLDPRMGHRGA